jgi:hypothetical protein
MLEIFYEKDGFSRRNSNIITIHINSYFVAYLKIVFIGLIQDFTKPICSVNRGPHVATSLVLKWPQGYIST